MTQFTPSEALVSLRKEIDVLNIELANLLCQRLLLVHCAAPLKPTRNDVRLEDRIEEIINNVTPIADSYNIDRDYLDIIFRFIIEESIAREIQEWDKINT